MARTKYKSNNGTLEYECKIIGYNEKQMKSLVTVPFSWAKNHLNKKLKVTIEVIDE